MTTKNVPSVLKRGNFDAAPSQLIVDQLLPELRSSGPIVQTAHAKRALSLEGLDVASESNLEASLTTFSDMLKTAMSNAGFEGKWSLAQEHAVQSVALFAADPRGYAGRTHMDNGALRTHVGTNMNRDGHLTMPVPSLEPSADRVQMSMEAFDERANGNPLAFSATYNVQSAKQNEFGELFYPTVTLGPDQVGFGVNTRLILTYNEVTRAATGALSNFGRRNIIRAIIDATMLSTEQTRLVPVYRSSGTDSSANFVSGISTSQFSVNGTNVPTRPLKIGARFDILALSQPDAQLAGGIANESDAVDSSLRLGAVYLVVNGTVSTVATTHYFKFDVKDLPTTDFNAAAQGNTRLLRVAADFTVLVKEAQLNTAGSTASGLLAALDTYSVRLRISVTGSVDQMTGETMLVAAPVVVETVNDSTGAVIPHTGGAGATVAAAFADCAIAGYDLIGYRTNSNRRNRGKLLDVQKVNYLYTVPLLPPITALRPVGAQDSEDGNLLNSLVTATRVQTSNSAVTALLAAADALSTHAGISSEAAVTMPTLFGAASLLVTPAYSAESLDVAVELNSLTHSGRIGDLKALLINKIRDMAARMYADSGYGPALEAMYEGRPPKVTLLIGTDTIIERYLNIDGDTRVTGDQFDYKIVPCYDSRVAGKIYFSFGLEPAFNSGVVTPLHFGNMAWRPEMTLMMPMVRSGANVMELTVQPSFRHVTNLPILGVLTVTNIDDVVGGKVSIDFNDVTP